MKRISSFVFVMMLMMASFTAGVEYQRGDVDQDGEVGISDVSCLIDYLLSGKWGDEPATPEDGQIETFTVNGVTFNMVTVTGGSFMMGASDEDTEALDNEKPAHEVTLSGYSIGQTEVTQELWLAVMGSNPSYFTFDFGYGDLMQRPVESISWDECQEFIAQLNLLTGKTFRLPTEAEWEFAARGGNKSQGYLYSGSNNYYDVAVYQGNSDRETFPVGFLASNELGLYDMSGNVMEFCQDWYGNYSSDAQTNPKGPATGTGRVIRGGGCFSPVRGCRVSCRYPTEPSEGGNDLGLRLAL